MKLLLLVLWVIPLCVSAQKSDPKKIIVTISDTTNIYQKVKYALVNNDFIVKDNGNKDTLTTYVREYKGLYCSAMAVIDSNTVILQGSYGLKRIDDFGYTQAPKSYKPIRSFGGRGKTWGLLLNVANQLGKNITFSQ
jgi:hypothetical protein